MTPEIESFLAAPRFAVAGASRDRNKYGNKVLRCYLQHGKRVTPIHPTEDEIEGVPCVRSLVELGDPEVGVSIVTPPPVTLRVVRDAIAAGVTKLWMQPGAESDEAVALAEENGITCIHGGPCVLVVMGYHEDPDPD